MLRKSESPLVSIIVPVYGTEKYLSKCLESIVNQIYTNLEIITVNDKTPDRSEDIIKAYQKIDSRIKLVNNPENYGLFRARMEGAKQATGKYIMFVDSDDYIGVDYVHSMVDEAIRENADIVKAQFVLEDESQNRKFIYNYINYRPRITLDDNQIIERYFEQEGLDFSWHILCGKLYSMELWNKCVPYYKKITTHLIMTEDIAYSTVLFSFAKKYSEVDCDTYFYLKRKDASTGITNNVEKYEKNISDLKTAFEFREDFLEEIGTYHKFEQHNKAWKANYARSWKNAIKWGGFKYEQAQYLERLVKEALKVESIEEQTEEDAYFYSCTTEWSDREETIKKQIADRKIRYISFDIFDTLIFRPFFEPSDLFRLLEIEFKKINKRSNLDFSKIRIEAEQYARNTLKSSGKEEITLDQIYNLINIEYNISVEILNQIKEKEKELEIEFCYKRQYGYKLYELALFMEKNVIITSDMYLPKDTIKTILSKNGYTEYIELFVSSEEQKTKATGNLFHHIIKKYGKNILHIGDNFESDYRMPLNVGLESIFLPKAISIFRGELRNYGYYAGNSYYSMIHPFGSYFDHKISCEFWGIRCMLGVVANTFFDNPYYAFNTQTDFNANLYLMSYYALGMHLYAMILDLLKNNRNRETIHFVARDGYACKVIYEVLKKYLVDIPESNYLYLSRKALLPLTFTEPADVYFIKDNISMDAVKNKTPRMIFDQFLGIECGNSLEKKLKEKGLDVDNYFKSDEAFNEFLKLLAKEENLIGNEERQKHVNIKNKLNEIIKTNDILFDIGYNGTAQKILTNLLERPIDAYYAYINKDRALVNEIELGCHVQTFYPATPLISGGIRELLFSKGEPSCIGYKIERDTLLPLLEDDKLTYIEKEIYRVIKRGVQNFAEDFTSKFAQYLDIVTFRSYDVSIPFEFMMERMSEMDRRVFGCSYFEDDIFVGKEKLKMSSWWNNRIYQQETLIECNNNDYSIDYLKIGEQFYGCSRWKRTIIVALISPKLFLKKVKDNIRWIKEKF